MIRVTDPEDFDAYLGDADRARASGVFAEFATNPVIALADLPGLGAGPDSGRCRGIHIGCLRRTAARIRTARTRTAISHGGPQGVQNRLLPRVEDRQSSSVEICHVRLAPIW